MWINSILFLFSVKAIGANKHDQKMSKFENYLNLHVTLKLKIRTDNINLSKVK